MSAVAVTNKEYEARKTTQEGVPKFAVY